MQETVRSPYRAFTGQRRMLRDLRPSLRPYNVGKLCEIITDDKVSMVEIGK